MTDTATEPVVGERPPAPLVARKVVDALLDFIGRCGRISGPAVHRTLTLDLIFDRATSRAVPGVDHLTKWMEKVLAAARDAAAAERTALLERVEQLETTLGHPWVPELVAALLEDDRCPDDPAAAISEMFSNLTPAGKRTLNWLMVSMRETGKRMAAEDVA